MTAGGSRSMVSGLDAGGLPASLAELARKLHPLTAAAAPAAPAGPLAPARGARIAAAAVLLRVLPDGDVELLLTRRGSDLAHHPGQIAFAGGRLEPGETHVQAALREAEEEVALRPATVQPLGLLPAFYIPPSRFWLHPVVLHWRRPHPLHPAQAEVAEIFFVRLSQLTDRRRLRVVRLSRGSTWAWQLDGGRLLWGATGVAVAALLDRLAPGWTGGATPASLGPEQHVDPPGGSGRRGSRPVRLSALGPLPERPLSEVAGSALAAVRDQALVEHAAGAVARAARALLPADGRRVVVLAGPGGTGQVGLAAADQLRAVGCEVTVLTAGRPPGGGQASAAGAPALPAHDVVIDALLGSGFQPPLRGRIAALVAALHDTAAPQLAVDLPTGLHPERGVVGEAVSADVTVAIGAAPPAMALASAEPFIGDCYLWRPGSRLGLERLLLR